MKINTVIEYEPGDMVTIEIGNERINDGIITYIGSVIAYVDYGPILTSKDLRINGHHQFNAMVTVAELHEWNDDKFMYNGSLN